MPTVRTKVDKSNKVRRCSPLFTNSRNALPRYNSREFSAVFRIVNEAATTVPITVTSPCWRIGVLRRKVLYQIAPPRLATAELARGQVHAVTLQVPQFLSGWHNIRQEIAKHPFPRIGLWSLRCGFDTTIGKKFFGPLNR